MKVRGSSYFAIFFLLLGLYGIIQSVAFQYWESMVLPVAISSLIFITAAVEVARSLYRSESSEKIIEDKKLAETNTKAEKRRLGLVLVWTIMFMLSTYLLGFRIAIPLFSFSYLKWRGKSWLTATIFAITILALMYGIFELTLKVPLFKGLIFSGKWHMTIFCC